MKTCVSTGRKRIVYNLADIVRWNYCCYMDTWSSDSIARQYHNKSQAPKNQYDKTNNPIVDFNCLSDIVESKNIFEHDDNVLSIHVRLGDLFNTLQKTIPKIHSYLDIIKKYNLNESCDKCHLFFGNHLNENKTQSEEYINKLSSLFKKDRADFETKWNDIKVIIEYGMLSEDKFFDKAKKFALYPTVSNAYFTFDELIEKTKDTQTDKDGNQVILYTSNKEAQHSYIQEATAKGYEVLILDSPIISHLMQKLEGGDGKVKFTRIDSDHVDNLIKKDENVISKLSDEEKETLKPIIEGAVDSKTYTVQLEAMDSASSPFMITVPEFMRRMKEMQASGGGGMMGMGNFPDMYNLVVNTNSPLVSDILNNKDEAAQKHLISQAFDLAKLSQNLLHGEELTNFIKRSYELIK